MAFIVEEIGAAVVVKVIVVDVLPTTDECELWVGEVADRVE